MKRFMQIPLITLVVVALMATGCGTKKKKKTDGGDQPTMSSSGEDTSVGSSSIELMADSDSGKAGSLQSINFPFNSSTLTNMARNKLEHNVEFLKDNPSIEVQIEGHADERGGIQYNLALGENRANSVKRFLVANGISSSRVKTISFGKERPVAFGHDETSWSKNRRANFVVTAK